ncbi:MAG TPA: S8 family serine peptidase [Candidatus Syntrophosphaera sp.]|nr:S8 family serine peptidase [Candidatus Syntrophosphaera sp.]
MRKMLLLLSVFICMGMVLSAAARMQKDGEQPAFANDRIKVKLTTQAKNLADLPQDLNTEKTSFGIRSLDEKMARNGGNKLKRAHRRVNDTAWEQTTGFDRWFIIMLDGSTDVQTTLADFLTDPEVEDASLEYYAYTQAVPNDTYYDDNWGHNNTGQFPSWQVSTYDYTGPAVGTPGWDTHAEEAWNYGYGNSSIVIAIIDSGVDTSHPDLTLVAGYDYGVGDNNPMDDAPDAGHGTQAAGIAAAKANNNLGVVGSAGGCSIMPLKVASATGGMTFTAIANAITHAADNGAHVISMSLGAQGISSDPTVDPTLTYANNAGVVILASSGNYYDPAYMGTGVNETQNAIGYPSNNQYVISVGAAAPEGERKSFTSSDGVLNYGSCYGSATQDDRLAVDIMAPTELPSTDIQGTAGWANGDYNWYFGGTSCACPYAAGAVALLLSQDPTLTPAEIRTIITSTATDMTIGASVGWDMYTGYGLINLEAALNSLNLVSVEDPITFTATAASTTQIDLAWTQNAANNNVMVAWSATGTFGAPIAGTTYSAGNSITGGGTVLYNGSNTSYSHTGRSPFTTYYYKAWSVGDDSAKAVAYSPGVTAQATTLADGTERITFFAENWDGDLNDWYAAQANQTNFWTIANATYRSSPYCAYITNSSSTLVNAYTRTATSVSHLYAPVYFPPGNSYQLNFAWKSNGQATYDVLEVFLVNLDLNILPTAGTAFSTTYRIGGPYNGQGTTWQTPAITLNNNVSDTVQLLIFSWKNNNSTANQPPAAVDDISISGILPNPLMGFSDTEFDYGLALKGSSVCTPHLFEVGNMAGSTLTINSGAVSLTGIDPGQFTLVDDNTYPINLIHGQTASWTVKFEPQASSAYGEKTANLQIVDNTAKGSVIIPQVDFTNTLTGATRIGRSHAEGHKHADCFVRDLKPRAQDKATYAIPLRGFAVEEVHEDYYDTYTNFALTFAPWTLYDGDGYATYGIDGVTFTNSGYTGSYIIFNPASTTPALTGDYEPYSGTKYAACFAATTPPNNDWLISPALSFGDSPRISFFAKSITDQYGLERFKVLYSTTGNAYTSFTNYLAGSATTYVEAPTEWTLYEYALPPSCANTTAYIAIQCVSNDAFAFMVDDFVAGDYYEPVNPIELSSFTAAISADNYVNLTWVTQTETGVQGFYVLRNSNEELATATTVSELIQATNTSQQQTYIFTDAEIQEDGTYYYWLQNSDLDGTVDYHGPISIAYAAVGSGTPSIPLVTSLAPAYPNPFNPSTTLSYSLAEPAPVVIDIYNQRGQIVRSYHKEHSAPGQFSLAFDGRDRNGVPLSSGVYLYRMSAGTFSQFRKMVLCK